MRPETVIIPPRGVITRGSTDTEAIDDPLVAAVVGYVRQHACEGIDVADLLQRFPISRRTLERRFRRSLDCSPLDLIRQARLKRVKTLLEETEMKLDTIAALAGYSYTAYMVAQFREAVGMTPGQFRRRAQRKRSDAARHDQA